MTSANASAISAFLAGGGQIVKVQEATLVTAQELLDYLQSCGVTAKYSGSNPKVYWCEGKRVRLRHVLGIANRQRSTQQLPPFAVEF